MVGLLEIAGKTAQEKTRTGDRSHETEEDVSTAACSEKKRRLEEQPGVMVASFHCPQIVFVSQGPLYSGTLDLLLGPDFEIVHTGI